MTKKLKKTTAFLSAVAMVMAMLLYFPSGMFSNIDWGLKASAEGETQTENWIAFAATEFAGGTGTEGDPYQIATADQLACLAKQVNTGTDYSKVFFKLTADIDLGGKEWTPIGISPNSFKGKFSGNGHKIKNLTVNSESFHIGLFGLNGGTIMNVGIESGSVTGTGDYIGGVCGYNEGGTISNCYNTGSVTGKNYVGGVCGYNEGGSISNCYNTAIVKGTVHYVGGVCGYNKDVTISNCYNTASVTGNIHVGGVCGGNFGAEISNCYNTGSVTGNTNVGGVCGENFEASSSNCYYLKGTAGNGIGSGPGSADPKTLDELCASLPNNFDTNIWTAGSAPTEITTIAEGSRFGKKVYTLPSLIGVGTAQTIEFNYYNFSTTETTEWQEYTPITDAAGLQAINDNLSGKYVLMNDIDLSTVANFTPIGKDYINAFTGKFSGDGHKIKNLKINSESNYIGLFSFSNGTIMNVGIEGGSVKGGAYIGGVCGYNTGGTISNCYNTGSVTGGKSVGGVCGYNCGTITNCYNTGNVTGTVSCVGGVCGENYQGTISNCYNTGSVTGGKSVGGVCGSNDGTITNCYNTGDIIGKEYTSSILEESNIGSGSETQKSSQVGGVCGFNNYGCTISNCYNTGNVSVTGNEVGGVCGYNNRGTISNCYNTGKVTGTGEYFGGVCGDNDQGTISNCYYLAGKATGGINGSDAEGSAKAIAYTTLCDETELPTGFYSSVWANGKITCNPIEEGSRFGTGAFVLPSLIDVGTAQTISTGDDKLFYNFGTTDEPDWQDYTPIRTAEELKAIGKDSTSLGKNYVLMEDIDLKDITNFTPIGTDQNKAFTGKFSGNGHKITNLTINKPNENYIGLFGFSKGTIMNVGIEGGSVTGGSTVGGVCGRSNGTISNCYNTASVTGTINDVGGVCGYNCAGTISNCYNTGVVSGNDRVGGVCGYNEYGTIANCYNTGNVSGSSYVGGVCGYNSSGSITNCYNRGTVSGSGNSVGGVCGNNSDGTIANCYFDSKVYNGNAVVNNNGTVYGNVLGKTTKQFTSGEVAYLLSQDGSVWGQEIGKDLYPVLGGKKVYLTTGECVYYTNTFYEEEQSHSYNNNNGICDNCGAYEPAALTNDKYDINGDGIKDEVYEISNANQLYWFAKYVNDGNTGINAVLTADITVNSGLEGKKGLLDSLEYNTNGEVTNGDSFKSWTPIGNFNNKYTGIFDGQNHTISGLYFDKENTDDVGLFGCSKGTIKNVGVVDSYFNGNEYVGGVCGNNFVGTITNCYNRGTVSGSKYVGGVCGYRSGGTIENCYNTGKVSGTGSSVGGVCGYNNYGEITNCYNTGKVSGTGSSVGGVCGYNFDTITNCYNRGTVSGSSNVGGVCGTNNSSTITNCYFDSKVYTGNAVGNNMGTVSANVLGKETTQFTSGEVAYLLSQGCTVNGIKYDGSIWGQTIGTDLYPVLGGKMVYKTVGCTGYSNQQNEAKAHTDTDSNNICDKCGAVVDTYKHLQTLITSAKAIEQGNYSDPSYKELQNAIEYAEQLTSDDPEEELNIACDDLQKAISNLKEYKTVVSVSSNPDNSGILTGGGNYAEGETITLTAKAVSGYKFLGWYQDDSEISTDTTYEIEVTAETPAGLNYVAKYVANENKKLSVTVGNGTVSYSYNDKKITVTWSSDTEEQFAKGTYFTVKANPSDGYTFLYWVNADGRILTEKPEFSFYLGDNMKLQACYKKAVAGSHYVVFKDMNGKVLWSGDVTMTEDNGAYGTVALPEHGTFAGYDFSGWKYSNGNAVSLTETGAVRITEDTVIYADYTAKTGLKLTVNGVEQSQTYAYASLVTVTAEETKDNKYFSGWYSGGKLVSDSLEYSFYITGNTPLTAKYDGDDVIVKQPLVNMTMSDRTTIVETGKQTVVMDVTWSVPEGYKFVEGGLVRSINDTDVSIDSLKLENVDGTNVKKNTSKLKTAEGTYSYTLTLGPVSSQKNLYARGYITYKNDATGEVVTMYTDKFTSNAN